LLLHQLPALARLEAYCQDLLNNALPGRTRFGFLKLDGSLSETGISS
jgi:hypothetical protein